MSSWDGGKTLVNNGISTMSTGFIAGFLNSTGGETPPKEQGKKT